jgi:hypothetical protein
LEGKPPIPALTVTPIRINEVAGRPGRTAGTYETREDAVAEGRNLARVRKVEHIKKMDGTIGSATVTATTHATSRVSRLGDGMRLGREPP